MGNPNEFDRELLSAYLDDALASSDRSRAEHLLATNAGASRYLDQLQATRECLKSVPSSKPRSSLTARVLEQARAQALADGLPSDHHVLRASARLANDSSDSRAAASSVPATEFSLERAADSVLRASAESGAGGGKLTDASDVSPSGQTIPSDQDHWSTKPQRLPQGNRIMWSAVAVAAAALVCLALLPLTWTDQPQDFVAELPRDATTQERGGDGVDAPSPFESVAPNDAAIAVANGNEPFEENQPVDRSGGVAHVMQGSGAEDALKDDLAPQRPVLDFLMIVDAVVSDEAWANGQFERLLEELAIPIDSPIVTDNELFQVLEETRVVVGSADAAGQQPRAALVFLRAPGTTLDRLHQAMHEDRTNFPQVVTDLSIDKQSALLHKLLRGQSVSQSQRERPSARVLSASVDVGTDRDDVVPHFVPAARPKMISSERKTGPALPAFSGLGFDSEDPMFEVLVILREPATE